MEWKLIEDCIDSTKFPFQSKGKVATYYLKLGRNAEVEIEKYDADLIKEKFKIINRIGDSFFRVYKNVNTGKGIKLVEKLILVETKGKSNDYFEQLEQSFELFKSIKGNIHGRFVGLNVPAIFDRNLKPKLNTLQSKFAKKNGTLRYGNRIMREEIISIEESELSGENKNSRTEKIKL